MIHNVTLNDYGKVCKSCTILLLIITFIIIIGISSVFFTFIGLGKTLFQWNILIWMLPM